MTEKEFTAGWIKKLSDGVLKNFPDNFLNSETTKPIDLPGIDLIPGEELFGNYDLLDTKHNSVMIVDDFYTAKYIIYSNRTRPARIQIPTSINETIKIVKSYENHLDGILKLIQKDYSSLFPKTTNHLSVINEIFNNLNIKRI